MLKFNKPFVVEKSFANMHEAVNHFRISGDGFYSKKCNDFFKYNYKFKNNFLTPSCTAALEMTALLMNIKPGDEVIMPSFTFVSCANAFVLRGATIRFIDSNYNEPNIDVSKIEALINKNTKAIVAVHYAGIPCEMDELIRIKKKYSLLLIEDCAHAIDSYYKNRPLGSFGDFSTFSFHDTKNITCGEGGLLVVNNKKYVKRAEIIREKGTNRTAFFRGEIKKYSWVDIGSSYLLSDLSAAYLYGQLMNIKIIQSKRIKIFNRYLAILNKYNKYFKVPENFIGKKYNGHMFYIILKTNTEKAILIKHLSKKKIQAVSHYVPLHNSKFYKDKNYGSLCKNADLYSNRLLRLPLHPYLKMKDVDYICENILNFYEN
ncbi:dTDP-4-amino-4,6-dideoxygalactose transaminase [Methylophilaceae bacterium]|nr:dTDP-4-amino-4,6-dideoxygalactose transaminase [Methylophilaceae bacterium]